MSGSNSDFNLNMFHGSLDECISIGNAFVQHIIDALTIVSRMLHFSMLSSCLIHLHIPLRKMKETNEWLHKLIGKFNIDSQIVDMKRCFNEREDFVGMLVRFAK